MAGLRAGPDWDSTRWSHSWGHRILYEFVDDAARVKESDGCSDHLRKCSVLNSLVHAFVHA